MDITLARDFEDFLRLLRKNGVEYLLIGGYAVGYHGYSRFTGDMDIWISASRENRCRAVAALSEFGFAEGVTEDLFDDRGMVRLGVRPVMLEVVTSISGVNFDECYKRRMIIEVNGMTVDVIGFEDLLTNKRASGRLKDLADLEILDPGE